MTAGEKAKHCREVLRKTLTHPCIIAAVVGMVLLGCRLLGIDALATGVSVILAAMPMGGTTAILAAKYGCDAAFAGKCVAVSTLLSIVTTPLWCLAI